MVQKLVAVVDTQFDNKISIGQVNLGDKVNLELEVTMGGEPLVYENPTFNLIAKKSDGTRVRQTEGITLSGGTVIIDCDEQLSTYKGAVSSQLIIKDGDRVSTCIFYFTVGASLEADIIVNSLDKVNTLDDLDELISAGFENLAIFEAKLSEYEVDLGSIIAEESKRITNENLRVTGEADRKASESERITAESVRVASESARVSSEEERIANEMDRVNNEADRRMAENIRKSNEAKREAAEEERANLFELNEEIRKEQEKQRVLNEKRRVEAFDNLEDREGIRLMAEQNRVTAENEREVAEANRRTAELEREAAEENREATYTAFNEAESERVSSEIARKTAEANRVEAEARRVEAESNRDYLYRNAEENRDSSYSTKESNRDSKYAQAEKNRDALFESNEANRKDSYTIAERKRVDNENIRQANEVARDKAEVLRANGELARESKESARVQAESNRVTAEQSRVTAESKRVTDFEKIKSDINTLDSKLTQKVDTKLADLEALNSNFKQDITAQYEDIVTKNAEFKTEMTEDFGNAKEDYFGKEHNNVVDRLNSDFDNVHQRINDASYLEYEGSNIKADNSYYGLTKDLTVKGRTLQNLTEGSSYAVPNEIRKNINSSLVKSNTKYTLIFTKPITENYIMVQEDNLDGTFKRNITLKIINSRCAFTTGGDVKYPWIKGHFTNGWSEEYLEVFNSIVVLEGDYSSTPIEQLPYVEGIQGVGDLQEDSTYKVEVESTGKNLFDIMGYEQYCASYSSGYPHLVSHILIEQIASFEENKISITSNVNMWNQGAGYCFRLKKGTDYTFSINNISDYPACLKIFGIWEHELPLMKPISDSSRYLLNQETLGVGQCTRTFNLKEYDGVFIYIGGKWASEMNESREYSFSNIQLEEGSTATSYAPYVESKSSVILPEQLHSLPNGVADEIVGNKIIRRIGKVVLDGNEKEIWLNNIRDGRTQFVLKNTLLTNPSLSIYQNGNAWCDTLPVIPNDNPIRAIWVYEKNDIVIQLPVEIADTVDKLRAWLSQNPTTVYYELAEPVIIKHNKTINLKTFEGTTHIVSENYLPATITAKVPSNVNAVVMSLKEENKALTLENEKLNNELNITNENLETLSVEQGDYIFDNDYRITMLELGLA